MTSSITWKDVWKNKGKLETNDLKFLNGYEAEDIDFKKYADGILKNINYQKEETILEVGGGAGALSEFLPTPYTTIDQSESLIQKHKLFFPNHTAFVAEANKIPFSDQSFDHVIMCGVSHYFPNLEYFHECVRELERVAKKSVFIGDIRLNNISSSKRVEEQNQLIPNVDLQHLTIDKQILINMNYQIIDSFRVHYGNPYNAIKIFKDKNLF